MVILAGGLGNPYFTTDTAAALRASEINADIVIKATKVNGIYSADPLRHLDARRYERLSYRQVLQDKLEVMDMTAFTVCEENGMPIPRDQLLRRRRPVAGGEGGARHRHPRQLEFTAAKASTSNTCRRPSPATWASMTKSRAAPAASPVSLSRTRNARKRSSASSTSSARRSGPLAVAEALNNVAVT